MSAVESTLQDLAYRPVRWLPHLGSPLITILDEVATCSCATRLPYYYYLFRTPCNRKLYGNVGNFLLTIHYCGATLSDFKNFTPA